MTVIAWDGNTLAVDKQLNNGDAKFPGTKCKRLKDGQAIAWDGLVDAGMMLADWYESGGATDKFPFKITDDAFADLVVVRPDGSYCWYVQSSLPHTADSKFMAWGIGRNAAMVALELGASAVDAVKLASKYVDGCGFGVDSIDVVVPGQICNRLTDFIKDRVELAPEFCVPVVEAFENYKTWMQERGKSPVSLHRFKTSMVAYLDGIDFRFFGVERTLHFGGMRLLDS